MKKDFEFCFKGARDYVHGTDIYTAITKSFSQDIDGGIDLSFHGIARKNLTMSDLKPEDEALIKSVVKYRAKDGSKKVFYGVENAESIFCNYAYEEEKITQASSIDLEKKSIVLEKQSEFSFIEEIVAMNKELLLTLFPDQKGKWYFTRLQIASSVEKTLYPLELEFRSNFQFKLTKTEIFMNKKSLGYIYFSLI